MMLVGASAANMTNLLSGWVVGSMGEQQTVNLPPYGTLSSILRRPTMKPKRELELLKYLHELLQGCECQDYPHDDRYVDWDKLVLKIYDRIEELNEVSDTQTITRNQN